MSDNNGTQVSSQGAQGPPAAGASGRTDAEVSDIRELYSSLSEQIQVLQKELSSLKKLQQKTKDKRIYEIQEQIGSLEDQTARLEKHLGLGKSPTEAMEAVKAEIEQEQFIQDFRNVKERVENMPTGNEQISLVEREAVILRSLGLDANDPRVVAIQKKAETPEDYVKTLEESWWDLKKTPVAGAGEASPKGGGTPPGEPSLSDLVAAYEEELAGLRGTPDMGNPRAIQEIRKKYLSKYPKLAGHI